MVARFFTCALAYFFVASSMLAIGPKSALAQPNPTATNSALNFYGDGFVLLQHGAVLQGFVKPQADSVTVVMDKGKQVTLAKKQILVIGPSMESLYKYQTRAIRKWGTGEHWHLAQWCIQNGMLDQAIEHYLELEKQAADNPKFKQLDLQLKQALMADENVRQAMAIQGILPPEPVCKPVPYSHERPHRANHRFPFIPSQDISEGTSKPRSHRSLSQGVGKAVAMGFSRKTTSKFSNPSANKPLRSTNETSRNFFGSSMPRNPTNPTC